uniref:Uncharacterized protein n=1 Tax=Anguilla anguilla TaxID=7936 RepID=A0A0E9U7F4_ANGAN
MLRDLLKSCGVHMELVRYALRYSTCRWAFMGVSQ